MKILIYGAGVVGSYLTSILCQNKHDVYLVARGRWKDTLDEKGLRVHHYIQRKNTVDYPNIISSVDSSVKYDAVFSVMQQQQTEEILDELAAVDTPLLMMVGNNICVKKMEDYITEHSKNEKKIMFGFSATGGHRNEDSVECVRFGKAHLTCGFAGKETDEDTKEYLEKIFKEEYKPEYASDMDSWLKIHAASILPLCYLSYAVDCNLRNSSGQQREMCLNAVDEAYGLLEKTGCEFEKYDDEIYFKKGSKTRKKFRLMFDAASKTKIGELAVTDHCRVAVKEIKALDASFEEIRNTLPAYKMPAWDELRGMMPSWELLEEMYSSPVPKKKKSVSDYVAGQLGNPTGRFGQVVTGAMNVVNSEMYGEILTRIHADSDSSILDIGYGNGYLIRKMYEKTGAAVFGIDLSVDMYLEASRKNKKYIREGKIRLGVGDCTDLRFKDESFDTVTTMNTIYFWDDTLKGMKEIYRCLKKGGEFINASYTTERLQKLPYTRNGFKFFEIEDYMALGKKAGFSRVQVKKICGEKGYIVRYVK